MQETKITKARIKNHFTYSWWKYVLLVLAAIIGWNLIYTSTAYRPPKGKRLDIYFVTNAVPDETLAWMKDDILERYPEVEDSSVASIVYTADDNYYGSMQLTTYVGAGEGDLILLPRERFEMFAKGGTFFPLDEVIESGALDLRGIDISATTLTTDEGETGIYGVPLTSLYGLMEYSVDNRDLVVGVLAYSPNFDRAVDWIDWLIETMQAPKPEWLEVQEAKQGVGAGEISNMPSF